MHSADSRSVRLDIASRIEMLEMVQTVLSHVAGIVGFDEDSSHYMSVAVREAVVNAIKHGNQMDESKRVAVEFVIQPSSLQIIVEDHGKGFDPTAVPDPVAEENLLKAAGRGIFFMRSFMDEVTYSFAPEGSTRVSLVKRVP